MKTASTSISRGVHIVPNPKAKLLDQVREVLRLKHYSLRTEETYVGWIKRFIFFHQKRHPREMGGPEIVAFLSDLAVRQHVSASTQNQAFNALLFLYRDVLHLELGELGGTVRAKPSRKLPVVLSGEEVARLLAHVEGTYGLMAPLLYGTGMRLMECVRLRVKDVDFELNHLVVRDGKGFKDRVTVLPDRVRPLLLEHLRRVRALHEQDLAEGYGLSAFGPKRALHLARPPLYALRVVRPPRSLHSLFHSAGPAGRELARRGLRPFEQPRTDPPAPAPSASPRCVESSIH